MADHRVLWVIQLRLRLHLRVRKTVCLVHWLLKWGAGCGGAGRDLLIGEGHLSLVLKLRRLEWLLLSDRRVLRRLLLLMDALRKLSCGLPRILLHLKCVLLLSLHLLLLLLL